MADQSTGSGGMFAVGDYVVEKQIGSGSFSTVWHGRHRLHGTEVAIKEIVTARLNSKLQHNLKSEIVILKKIDHPNIIRLHDMIEESGKIYIILEYCRGGDLSVYIQKRQGRIPEANVKHFMHQLASGLKVLRENNLIHRDLKPQNLLLSSSEDKSVLKIADFGFARSLQPRGLAETLCGSPLYMAPEIMQLQKYDAKADLWSVGTILYQLLIGKTPYTGANQMQLLQNIVRNELQFPPDTKYLSPLCIDLCRKLLRRNPVERLTFEEFFDHPFFSQRLPDELSWNLTPHRVINSIPLSQANPVRHAEESFQENCLPFSLDNECCGPEGTPSFVRRAPLTPSFREVHKSLPKVEDSLDLIYLDYVIVTSPTLDVSSMLNTCKLSNLQSKSGSPLQLHGSLNNTSAPMPIVGTAAGRVNHFEMFESCAPGILPESLDMKDASDQRSSDSMTRIRTLEQCASCISELVFEKINADKHLEAFSLQLVIISIRKEMLHICHMHPASGIEGSATLHGLICLTNKKASLNIQKLLGESETRVSLEFCSQIEKMFLLEIGHAEELAKAIEPGNTEMPDAVEAIFQFALAFGRRGGVDEYMGNADGAVVCYSKAVNLFQFILVEAPIILNPPFSLSNSDRLRLQNYVKILNSRRSISRSERTAHTKS